MLMGMSTGEISFEGTSFSFQDVLTRLRPVQKPYPPLWYPTSNVNSIAWIAAQGINTAFSVHLSPEFDRIADSVKRYWAEYTPHANDPGRLNGHVPGPPKVGFSVHIHVAESDAQAQEQARPAFELFQHNFTYRYVRRGNAERYADRKGFEDELARGRIVVGSPGTVRERLGDYLNRSGANYILGCFTFGSLTLPQILRSVELFASEVVPALAQAREVAV
jgi:alkanesulfonate monooxygenase SsuD/methylene tetrahydromethanopterin reductase-like flavin-dependent oxidoreductase (luciferase family)